MMKELLIVVIALAGKYHQTKCDRLIVTSFSPINFATIATPCCSLRSIDDNQPAFNQIGKELTVAKCFDDLNGISNSTELGIFFDTKRSFAHLAHGRKANSTRDILDDKNVEQNRKHQKEKSESGAQTSIAEVEKEVKTPFMAALVFIFSLCLVTAIFIGAKKMKNDRKKLLEDKMKSESRLKEVITMENELIGEIEKKSEELAGLTRNLSMKNQMLDEMRRKLEMVRPTIGEDARVTVTKLIRSIQYSQHANKDWDNYKIYFESLHENFFRNLKGSFTHLKPSDLKLCTLLRLNLSSREIADIMEISPQSVRVMIHRLRKKLLVQNDLNLSSFLSGFDPEFKTASTDASIHKLD